MAGMKKSTRQASTRPSLSAWGTGACRQNLRQANNKKRCSSVTPADTTSSQKMRRMRRM